MFQETCALKHRFRSPVVLQVAQHALQELLMRQHDLQELLKRREVTRNPPPRHPPTPASFPQESAASTAPNVQCLQAAFA
jgi:hypothetical protein